MKYLTPSAWRLGSLHRLTVGYPRLYLLAALFYYMIWLVFNYVEWPDSSAYLEMGLGLYKSGVFGYQDANGVFYPNAFRMPTFPVLLGTLHQITGNDAWAFFSFSLLQLFLAATLPCFGYFWGSQITRSCGRLCYIFVLTSPNVMLMSVSVLTDVLFALAANAAFILLWSLTHKPLAKTGLQAGLAIGIACMVRPIMKLYPAAALLWLCVSLSRSKRSILVGLCLIGGFAAIMIPWIARNYVLYRTVVLETNQGLNLLWSNAGLVTVRPTDSTEQRRLKEYILRNTNAPMQLVFYRGHDYFIKNDLKISTELGRVAVEAYKEQPHKVLVNWFHNYRAVTMGQVHTLAIQETFKTRPAYRWLASVMPLTREEIDRKSYHLMLEAARALRICYAWLTPLGVMVLVATRRWRLALFIYGNIFYFTGLTSFVAGYDRYRLNLEPLYALLILVPICAMFSWISNRSRRSLTSGPLTTIH